MCIKIYRTEWKVYGNSHFQNLLIIHPNAPGSSSDKQCFVKIVDSKMRNLGEIPVPMIQLAGIEWSNNKASIRMVGEWDFEKGTCYYWSKGGNRRIFVKR